VAWQWACSWRRSWRRRGCDARRKRRGNYFCDQTTNKSQFVFVCNKINTTAPSGPVMPYALCYTCSGPFKGDQWVLPSPKFLRRQGKGEALLLRLLGNSPAPCHTPSVSLFRISGPGRPQPYADASYSGLPALSCLPPGLYHCLAYSPHTPSIYMPLLSRPSGLIPLTRRLDRIEPFLRLLRSPPTLCDPPSACLLSFKWSWLASTLQITFTRRR